MFVWLQKILSEGNQHDRQFLYCHQDFLTKCVDLPLLLSEWGHGMKCVNDIRAKRVKKQNICGFYREERV